MQYFVLAADQLGPIADATDDQLKAFYTERQAAFRAPVGVADAVKVFEAFAIFDQCNPARGRRVGATGNEQ